MDCGSPRQNLGLESVLRHGRAKDLGILGKRSPQTFTEPPELMLHFASCTLSAPLLGWPCRNGETVDSRFDEQKGPPIPWCTGSDKVYYPEQTLSITDDDVMAGLRGSKSGV